MYSYDNYTSVQLVEINNYAMGSMDQSMDHTWTDPRIVQPTFNINGRYDSVRSYWNARFGETDSFKQIPLFVRDLSVVTGFYNDFHGALVNGYYGYGSSGDFILVGARYKDDADMVDKIILHEELERYKGFTHEEARAEEAKFESFKRQGEASPAAASSVHSYDNDWSDMEVSTFIDKQQAASFRRISEVKLTAKDNLEAESSSVIAYWEQAFGEEVVIPKVHSLDTKGGTEKEKGFTAAAYKGAIYINKDILSCLPKPPSPQGYISDTHNDENALSFGDATTFDRGKIGGVLIHLLLESNKGLTHEQARTIESDYAQFKQTGEVSQSVIPAAAAQVPETVIEIPLEQQPAAAQVPVQLSTVPPQSGTDDSHGWSEIRLQSFAQTMRQEEDNYLISGWFAGGWLNGCVGRAKSALGITDSNWGRTSYDVVMENVDKRYPQYRGFTAAYVDNALYISSRIEENTDLKPYIAFEYTKWYMMNIGKSGEEAVRIAEETETGVRSGAVTKLDFSDITAQSLFGPGAVSTENDITRAANVLNSCSSDNALAIILKAPENDDTCRMISRILGQMDNDAAGEEKVSGWLAQMPAERAAKILKTYAESGIDHPESILSVIPDTGAAAQYLMDIYNAAPSVAVGIIKGLQGTEKLNAIMNSLDSARAVSLVNALDIESAITVLSGMRQEKSLAVFSGFDAQKCKQVIYLMSVKAENAATLKYWLENMDAAKVSGICLSVNTDSAIGILSLMGYAKAFEALSGFDIAKQEEIITALSKDSRGKNTLVAWLSAASAGKTAEMLVNFILEKKYNTAFTMMNRMTIGKNSEVLSEIVKIMQAEEAAKNGSPVSNMYLFFEKFNDEALKQIMPFMSSEGAAGVLGYVYQDVRMESLFKGLCVDGDGKVDYQKEADILRYMRAERAKLVFARMEGEEKKSVLPLIGDKAVQVKLINYLNIKDTEGTKALVGMFSGDKLAEMLDKTIENGSAATAVTFLTKTVDAAAGLAIMKNMNGDNVKEVFQAMNDEAFEVYLGVMGGKLDKAAAYVSYTLPGSETKTLLTGQGSEAGKIESAYVIRDVSNLPVAVAMFDSSDKEGNNKYSYMSIDYATLTLKMQSAGSLSAARGEDRVLDTAGLYSRDGYMGLTVSGGLKGYSYLRIDVDKISAKDLNELRMYDAEQELVLNVYLKTAGGKVEAGKYSFDPTQAGRIDISLEEVGKKIDLSQVQAIEIYQNVSYPQGVSPDPLFAKLTSCGISLLGEVSLQGAPEGLDETAVSGLQKAVQSDLLRTGDINGLEVVYSASKKSVYSLPQNVVEFSPEEALTGYHVKLDMTTKAQKWDEYLTKTYKTTDLGDISVKETEKLFGSSSNSLSTGIKAYLDRSEFASKMNTSSVASAIAGKIKGQKEAATELYLPLVRSDMENIKRDILNSAEKFQITSSSISDGSAVSVNDKITITFSHMVIAGSLQISVKSKDGKAVSVKDVRVDQSGRALSFKPAVANDAEYTLKITGKNMAGKSLDAYSATFTTAPAKVPEESGRTTSTSMSAPFEKWFGPEETWL
ncbi:MAG: Ig-like domain-containing protein, partial [Candidatus Omnitrophota bacterium]